MSQYDFSEFDRLKRLPPYVFAEVNRLKAEARARGEDIIDFGMGNPDLTPPDHVLEKMKETLQAPKAHRYSMSRGIPGLRKALAGYYERRFGVAIDPEKEAIVTIGSKEGLANLAQAITSPGDMILTPNPSYPIHPFGFMIAGASLRHLPMVEEGAFINEDEFMEALDRAVRHSEPKPKALILNFPSNPTAKVASLSFYEKVVSFCRAHKIWLLSDLAYAEIYYGDTPPPSVLQIDGAKEIAIEFTSMSKSYSMAGWRVGFAAGNPYLIAALTKIKSYLDYGMLLPIQVAAAAALNGPQDYLDEIRSIYKDRRDVLVDGLNRLGWPVTPPEASMFVWAKIPEQFRAMGSLEFSKMLLQQAGMAVAPGVGFGEYGDGHVRLALVENTHRIRQALRQLRSVFPAAA